MAAESKKVKLEVSIPDAALALHVDARALESMVGNLVDNAIKYAREGGSVVVTASEQDGRVRVTVADDGPGIEARHLPRIFERFYRVDAGRSRQVGGTGLGLAIVKHLAEASGGVVAVESAVGRGSKFHLVLKRAPPN
jgi:two-component system phosphate regulon sensor histidine kinase PhoR